MANNNTSSAAINLNLNLNPLFIPNVYDQPDPNNLIFFTRSIVIRNDKELAAIDKCNSILKKLKSEIGEKELLLYYCKDSSDFVLPSPSVVKEEEEKDNDIEEDIKDEDKMEVEKEEKEEKLDTNEATQDDVEIDDKMEVAKEEKGKKMDTNEATADDVEDDDNDAKSFDSNSNKTEDNIHDNKISQKEITTTKIKEFVEYMTLRRRLLNRLSRRLNRVSRCVDGELSLKLTNPIKIHNILPPPPPRYGDVRHTFKKEDLPTYSAKRKEREHNQQKLKEAIREGNEEDIKRYKHQLIEYEEVIPLKELEDEDEDEEDIVEKYGNGINVLQRNMSTKEKVLEYRRWQNDIAACIVDQPTFQELGMMDAWNVENRLKKLEQQDDDDDDNNNNNLSDEEDEESKKEETAPKSNSNTQSKKRLSIASTPSFHTQDLHKIYSIHTDLIETTLSAKIQSTISEATTEFEKANAISQELFNRKLKYETELQNLQSVPIQKAIQKKQQVAMEWAMAKNNFTREANAVEKQFHKVVCANTLSNIMDRVVLNYAHVPRYNDYNFIRSTVASHLNKMVQNVNYQVETSKKYSSFVPAPHLLEAAAAVHNQDTAIPAAQEAEYKNKIKEVQNALRQAEEDRRRAWKKLQKVKADLLSFPATSEAVSTTTHHQQSNVTSQKARAAAMQQVRSSPNYNTAGNNIIGQHISVNTNKPASISSTTSSITVGASQNHDPNNLKYSAESVKARIYPDGSVMPVNLPKRNKDGTFQRPAGRKRKGMDWDAVRGRWMPAPGGISFDD